MCGFRFELLLAGTAIAVLAATGAPAGAAPPDDAAIEAAIPFPEPANVPPPTVADIGVAPAPAAPAIAAAPAAPAGPPATAPDQKDQDKAAVAEAMPPSLDQQVADKLREHLAGKSDRFFDRKTRAAVDSFYSARTYDPLWSENGSASERAKAAAAYLAKVDADGLDPADYPLPTFKAGADAAVLAETELRFTATVLTYARHAQMGRVHYSRISADIQYNQTPPDAAEVLGKMVDAKTVAGALDSLNPQQPGYKALKAALAEARAKKGDLGPKRIDHGPVLKLGKTPVQDPRVSQLRARLGVAGGATDTTYDKTLAAAVKKFQQQHGLSATGSLTSATINALNGPKRERDTDIIIANMERWRWMPRDLGKTYVMLNVPDFSLRVVHNGATVWRTKVVVGKPSTPTPIFSDMMKFITVNPTWNVPPSIVYNEYLPALQQDPQALERIGLKLIQNRDGSVHIYQPPGERNALGRLRFNFPNKFLVYQHDTPDKHLFGQDKRAYSHGCMRVQDPLKYAEVLLSITMPKEGYTQERLRKMFGGAEVNINFPTHVPVHIVYQTAFVDDAGKLVFRDDVYGRDERVLVALKGDDRRMAEVPMERARPNYSRPAVTLPSSYRPSYVSADGPSSFFERLFGGGAPTPPTSVPQRRVFAR